MLHAQEFRALAMEEFEPAIRAIATALRREPDFPDEATARAFALIRELSDRILGKRHFDVQILGAFAMIKGMLAEMATGEGKTLTATLVAGTAGLAGVPIHVITVNDYLVQRDAELMRPLYAQLGLTVGIVIAGQSAEERRAAYACDITYCTNKELAFDYLRDRMVLGQSAGDLTLKMEALSSRAPRSRQLRMRGLHFALVDEADSVLIDEARTPLIISGAAESEINPDAVARALELAATLEAGMDYILSTRRTPGLPDGPWPGSGRGVRRRAGAAVAQRHHARGTRPAGAGGDPSVPERRANTSSSKAKCRSSTSIPAASCRTGSGATACTR